MVMGGIIVIALAGFVLFVSVARRRRSAVPLGVQPGTPAFLALDARFAPDSSHPPDAPERPTRPPAPGAVGPSGTLGGHPEPPSLFVEAPPDAEGGEPL